MVKFYELLYIWIAQSAADASVNYLLIVIYCYFQVVRIIRNVY